MPLPSSSSCSGGRWLFHLCLFAVSCSMQAVSPPTIAFGPVGPGHSAVWRTRLHTAMAIKAGPCTFRDSAKLAFWPQADSQTLSRLSPWCDHFGVGCRSTQNVCSLSPSSPRLRRPRQPQHSRWASGSAPAIGRLPAGIPISAGGSRLST